MKQKELSRKILEVTMRIKREYPDLYKLLNETPMIFSADSDEINIRDFEEYLKTIEAQLNEKIIEVKK